MLVVGGDADNGVCEDTDNGVRGDTDNGACGDTDNGTCGGTDNGAKVHGALSPAAVGIPRHYWGLYAGNTTLSL